MTLDDLEAKAIELREQVNRIDRVPVGRRSKRQKEILRDARHALKKIQHEINLRIRQQSMFWDKK